MFLAIAANVILMVALALYYRGFCKRMDRPKRLHPETLCLCLSDNDLDIKKVFSKERKPLRFPKPRRDYV